MNEEVVKFSFFRSFWEGMEDLEDGDRLALYDAISTYAFTGVEPEFAGMMRTAWKLAKPNIDSSVKGQITGPKGGRPKKENPPLKPPVKTTSKTNKDMDMDRDMEMDAENNSSEKNCFSANASGDAAAAGAAPPAAKGNTLPECAMDGCGGRLTFDPSLGKFRCGKCRATFAREELWR